MSELLTGDAAANSILDAIAEPGDNEPIEGNETEQAIDNSDEVVQTETNAAEEGADDTAEADKPDPQPAIDPPVSWKADAKARFKELPPDLQRIVVDRESERDRGLNEAQRKSADEAKAYQAKAEAIEAERQAYANQLGIFLNVAKTSNPKMAEWHKRDWETYARENPLEAPAEWFAFQQQVGAIQAAEAEQHRVQGLTLAEARQKAHQTLVSKLDFWADPQKRSAFQTEFREYMKSNEFNDGELDTLLDPRAITLGRKAMLYDKLMAQQSKIAAAKKPQQPSKVLRSQATTGTAQDTKAERLAKIARQTGRTDDQAAYVLAQLNG